jgi:hypothetical protein
LTPGDPKMAKTKKAKSEMRYLSVGLRTYTDLVILRGAISSTIGGLNRDEIHTQFNDDQWIVIKASGNQLDHIVVGEMKLSFKGLSLVIEASKPPAVPNNKGNRHSNKRNTKVLLPASESDEVPFT